MRMIPLDCAAVHDAAPELVLGTLDGVERARVLDHLAGCARCREEVAALADTVSDLALLAPDLSPSAGFTDRILARGPALADGADNDEVPAFDGRELHPAAPVEVPVVPLRPRRRRAAALLVAAVALVALTVGVVVRRGPESTGSVAFAAMVAPDGGVMGSVVGGRQRRRRRRRRLPDELAGLPDRGRPHGRHGGPARADDVGRRCLALGRRGQ